MARCAACRIPLASNQPVRYVDEYVVHPGCVGRPILIERELASARSDASSNATLVTQRGIEIAELRSRIRTLERETNTVALARGNAERQATTAASMAEGANRRIAELERELAAARVQPEPADPVMQEDASSLRFKLLELK